MEATKRPRVMDSGSPKQYISKKFMPRIKILSPIKAEPKEPTPSTSLLDETLPAQELSPPRESPIPKESSPKESPLPAESPPAKEPSQSKGSTRPKELPPSIIKFVPRIKKSPQPPPREVSVERVRPKYKNPTLPTPLTAMECENYQYDDPELRKWQKEFVAAQMPEKPPIVMTYKEMLQEQVRQLKKENQELRDGNEGLLKEMAEWKAELRKIKHRLASKKYNEKRRSKKKEEVVVRPYESYHPHTHLRIRQRIWEDIVKSYGRESAIKIVEGIHKKEVIRGQRSTSTISTDNKETKMTDGSSAAKKSSKD